jgi:hypothetical protein
MSIRLQFECSFLISLLFLSLGLCRCYLCRTWGALEWNDSVVRPAILQRVVPLSEITGKIHIFFYECKLKLLRKESNYTLNRSPFHSLIVEVFDGQLQFQ